MLQANKHLKAFKHLKDDVKVMITYQGNKLSSRFQVEYQTNFEHRIHVVYCCKRPKNDCDNFYIGQTDRGISERIFDHNNRDKNSYPLQHAEIKKNAHVSVTYFIILNST